MYAFAPRVEKQFLRRLARLDDRSLPMAEIHRRARDVAVEMGIPRPSYERVRQELHAVRRRDLERRRALEIVLQLANNSRAPDAAMAELIELLT